MANSEQQVVKLMAQEIIKAIKKLNEENNKNYVDNQLKNIKTTNVGGGVSIPSNVTASQVVGLYSAIASYIANSPENSLAGDQEAGKIVSTISGLAAIEIQSATIDTAQIENLYSSYGEFLNLVAKNAEIEGLDVEELRAAISEIGLANIGSANIGWGQIKDLVTDTAIIREGVGGKLYIDRLAVTDAQILSLTTGELVIQGSDGKLYTVYVDAKGDVVTALRTVSGDDIEENTITSALIAEDAITARELNVSQIFADQALVSAIKASNIDVDDLFSNNAFINILTTSIIQSSSIGSELDISRNSSIVLTDKKIGLVVSNESTESNLVLTDKMVDVISNQINLNANKIDFSANESITAVVKKEVSEVSDVLFVGEEPAIPVVDMVWLDTSISPNLFKRYDGTGWVVINDISSIVSKLNSAELKIDANTAVIDLNTKSIDALGLKVESAELKITPEAITQVVRSSDAYIEDLASATMTADKFETFVSGSQGISSISQKANEIDLLIESGSSSTEVKFTDAAIQAFTDEMKVNVTDQIELKVGELQEQVDSAETQIKANTDAIALKASEQDVGILKERMSEAEEKITPEAITQTVRTSQGYTEDLEELSDRITTAESSIEQHSDEIALRVTKEEYSIIENKVVEQQSQIIQQADSITLLAGRVDDVEVEVEDTSIYEGAMPPEGPLNEGKIWLDRSVNPPIFRRWMGLDVPTSKYCSITTSGEMVQTPSQFKSINSVSIEFSPEQAGSGDPSPDNVRTLTGRTGISITHSGGGNEKTYEVDFGQIIFGGRYEWNTGILTNNTITVSLAGCTVSPVGTTSAGVRYGRIRADVTPVSELGYSSHYKIVPAGTAYVSGMARFFSGYIFIYDERFTDESTAESILAAENPQFVYEVAAEEIQLEATDIKTIDGINTFYTTDGEITIDVTGTGWETVNDTRELEESISKTVTKTELQHIIRIESDGLHVGAQGSQSEAIIDNDSFDIAFGGQVFSSFAGNYVEFGNYQIRRTADGGLAFKLR